MLRSMKELEGYNILARDGEIGKATDFLFDDTTWSLRYVVVDTGNFLTGRKVIVPPSALGKPDWHNKSFPVNLTQGQIKNSPPIESTQRVTRTYEEDLYRHYEWQPYWGGRATGPTPTGPSAVGGTTPEAGRTTSGGRMEETRHPATPAGHLKSVEDIRGFSVGATDGNIGEVDDFVIDDDAWHLRYAIVDTAKWLPGKKVMLPIPIIQSIQEDDSVVRVEVPKDNIKNAPEFDPNAPVNRKYEEILFDYYGRPRYWK